MPAPPAIGRKRRRLRDRRAANFRPPLVGYGIHTFEIAAVAPDGVSRWLGPSRIARASPRTYVGPYLLSAPHPAFGHLPRFAEKEKPATASSPGRALGGMRDPHPYLPRPWGVERRPSLDGLGGTGTPSIRPL